GEDYYANFAVQVPANAPMTRPYWHRSDPQRDALYQVDQKYSTLALPPLPLHVNIQYEIAGHKGLHSPAPEFLRKKHATELPEGVMGGEVVVPYQDEHGTKRQTALAITPALSVLLQPGEQVLGVAGATTSAVHVKVSSNLGSTTSGTVHVNLPPEWRAQPDSLKLQFTKRGETSDSDFNINPANLQQNMAEISADVESGRSEFREGYVLITRDDLGAFYYFQPALQHVSIVDVKVPKNLNVGYIMGAGDDIPTVLQQIGMTVTLIPADKLAAENLNQYGAIVLGVRAYDTQKEVVSNNKKLLDFVSNGGTLIVQNNNSTGDFNGGHFTPYDAELSHARVSVEEAPVKILAPDDRGFHYPNE